MSLDVCGNFWASCSNLETMTSLGVYLCSGQESLQRIWPSTMMITTTSMIKLIKMLKYPVVWVLARLVSVWISYSWASAILVALEWIVNAFWLFCVSPSQEIPLCTQSEAFPRTRMAKSISSSPLDNRTNIIDNNILIIGLSSLSDQFGMFYQTANLVTWR